MGKNAENNSSDVELAQRRLVTVSNRLPFNVSIENDEVMYHPSAGGLVTGLASVRESPHRLEALPRDHLWVGWPGGSVPPEFQDQVIAHALEQFRSYPVFLSAEQMEQFYFGFCNATIWPLFHYFPTYALYEPACWEQYRQINQIFADSLASMLRPDDVVWVHDYHLMLLPALLKRRHPQIPIGFFLHIPFPSFEIFRLLPREWRRDILEGLLGADLIGFHTHEYAHHFFQSVLRILGHDQQMGQIMTADRLVRVDTFPMGIDYAKFVEAASDPGTIEEKRHLSETLAGNKLILSVDRLDYSKGILNRLNAFELFLENNAEYHGKVALLMVVVPSRIGVVQYDLMKRQLEELVGKINGRFGKVGWTPVVYQYRHVPFTTLVALYSVCDVCLVTPLRDGMNLIAKEYLAARPDGTGVLILSEMAGAAKELPEALIVNPNNLREIADGLKDALEIPSEEQQRRNRRMQRRLQRYNVVRWASDFLAALLKMRELQAGLESKFLSAAAKQNVIQRYSHARQRLLFLDYDGTLTPLVAHPVMAIPERALIDLLAKLAANASNTVVLTSGRDRHTLERWFGALPIGLVGEHGARIRFAGQRWTRAKSAASDWMSELLPILETYADRLPGSFVEEKDDSVAWHYRMADPEQAALCAPELLDHLVSFTAKSDLQVVQGSKVIEVRRGGIDKGSAAELWLANKPADFILAVGDDSTDEDLFKFLPAEAITIRVGPSATHAQYNIRNCIEVLDLLRAFTVVGEKDR